jgi:hypothetical protein
MGKIFTSTLLLASFFCVSYPAITSAGVPGTIKWKFPLNTDISCSGPALGPDNTIYQNNGNSLTAITPEGTLKWNFNIAGADYTYIGTPSVNSDGNIFVHTLNGLYALDSTGKLLWNLPEVSVYDCLSTLTAIDQDKTVYVPAIDANSESRLYSINSLGQQKWASPEGTSAPAVGNSTTIYSIKYSLTWLNKVDGSSIMSSGNFYGFFWLPPSIGKNGDIYVIDEHHFHAFHPNGSQAWQYLHQGNFAHQPGEAVTGGDGTIYFSSYDYYQGKGFLHALKPDGSPKWIYTFPDVWTWPKGSPAVGYDGTVYVATSAGMSAFSPEGKLLWETSDFVVNSVLNNSPIIGSDGMLYVAGSERDDQNVPHPYLYAINTASHGPAASSWPMMGANAQHTRKAQTVRPQVLLLLHGMNSDPSNPDPSSRPWNDFVKNQFNGSCPIIFKGSVASSAIPNPKGQRCYQIKFGRYDVGGLRGLWDDQDRDGVYGYVVATDEKKSYGDFSTFGQLGAEVKDAVHAILNRTPNAKVTLVGHSRGGLAARAFLQQPVSSVEKASISGLLTIGTPHQGSRLGRIYNYLGSHLRYTCADGTPCQQDWQVADFLNGALSCDVLGLIWNKDRLDVRRPTIHYLADTTSPIKSLNANIANLPADIVYGEMAFKGFPLGLLKQQTATPEYSIFDRPFIGDVCYQVSAAAQTALLGSGGDPYRFNGDGIVTLPAQSYIRLPGFPGKLTPLHREYSNAVHVDETKKVYAISDAISAMLR